MKWIKGKELLPNDKVNVLVREGDTNFFGFYDQQKNMFIVNMGAAISPEKVEWMSLV